MQPEEKLQQEVIENCRNRDWKSLKSFIDRDEFMLPEVSYEYKMILMASKLLASACFEAYQTNPTEKKQYGLNIWNNNLYWSEKIPYWLEQDAVNLLHFDMAVVLANDILKDNAIKAQLISYINTNQVILCSLLSNPAMPEILRQQLLKDFEHLVTASPELSQAERNHYLNDMIENSNHNSDSNCGRNYVSYSRIYYKQRANMIGLPLNREPSESASSQAPKMNENNYKP